MSIALRLEEWEMLSKFQPLQDWVVLRKWERPKATAAGIVLIDDSKDFQSKRGTVIKIGPCTNLKGPKPAFEVGDEVLFSAFAGMEIPMPADYLIMRSTDILVVLEDKKK
jgi:co-chaperonin GroES (HSP10)